MSSVDEIKNVTVFGAGTMGSGIAQVSNFIYNIIDLIL